MSYNSQVLSRSTYTSLCVSHGRQALKGRKKNYDLNYFHLKIYALTVKFQEAVSFLPQTEFYVADFVPVWQCKIVV